MGARITIVGGGSHQWAPTLITDIAATESLHGSEIVLLDVDAARLPRMAAYVEHVSRQRGVPLTARATTDEREALDGADFVVVTISTGGFESMRHDLAIPARYGVVQPVGDTVGPGGISRALRNVPILVGIARDMERVCPGAWLLNLTNPLTALCRAVTRETAIRTVGLCHEVTITSFWMSLLLGCGSGDLDPVIAGVNHLPVVVEMRLADGDDGLGRLAALLTDDAALDAPLPEWVADVFAGLGERPGAFGYAPPEDGCWTKRALARMHGPKLELFRRFGALPYAGDRHTVEFFPGFVTEESGWGRRWGVALTTVEERERAEAHWSAQLDERLRSNEVAAHVSGELVAPVIDSLLTGHRRELPLNLPNAGQCAGLPLESVVESMCTVDGEGVRGRDRATLPPFFAEWLRRVVASQELTVDAALGGSRDAVVAAMLADPLAGRLDHDRLVRMTDDLLSATAAWLPQFG